MASQPNSDSLTQEQIAQLKQQLATYLKQSIAYPYQFLCHVSASSKDNVAYEITNKTHLMKIFKALMQDDDPGFVAEYDKLLRKHRTQRALMSQKDFVHLIINEICKREKAAFQLTRRAIRSMPEPIPSSHPYTIKQMNQIHSPEQFRHRARQCLLERDPKQFSFSQHDFNLFLLLLRYSILVHRNTWIRSLPAYQQFQRLRKMFDKNQKRELREFFTTILSSISLDLVLEEFLDIPYPTSILPS